MDSFEANTQSFIVKIWTEETASQPGGVSWRGQITHVLSGERLYFQNLDEIKTFMDRYLESGDDSLVFGSHQR